MKLVWIVLFLSVVLMIPFLLWGEFFEATFGGDEGVDWLRSWGPWAGLIAILLLVSDVILPIPATAVMAALGLIYGTFVGGLIGALGSFLAGYTAYMACRVGGRGVAKKIAGSDDLNRGERIFREVGGWLVALSRCLPLLPEVITCMAGLTRMPLRSFTIALACGSLPMAFVFAAVGDLGKGSPALSLTLSILLPVLIWPFARFWLRKKQAEAERN